MTVYENAVKAAAEGMGAINTQLAEQYDKEFALIQLISDETERQQALDQLNEKYNSDRLAAAQQYAQTLASIIMPVWQQEDIQGAAADIDTLTQKLREYIALLMQVQSMLDSGMAQDEVQSLFPELDFSGAMDQIAAIQTFLSDRKNLLPGLESMFSEAIPDEVLKIATDLDMTGAQTRWAEFAQNPGAITTEAIISGYGQQEGVEPPKLETVITISGYDLTAYRQFLADNPIEVEGVLRLREVFQNPEDALKAENVTFWQNGVEIPASLVPKELLTPDKVAVLDADGTIHILITPKIEGTAEAVSAAGEKLDERFVTTFIFGKNSQHDWGALNSVLGGSLIDWIANQIEFSKILCNHENRTFTVSFRCKPFWYQENVPEITLTTSGTFVTNPGNVYAEPVITVYGSGEITLMVGMTIVELDGITDRITLDTPLMEAYNGVTSMNGCMSGDFPTLAPGANAVSWTGNPFLFPHARLPAEDALERPSCRQRWQNTWRLHIQNDNTHIQPVRIAGWLRLLRAFVRTGTFFSGSRAMSASCLAKQPRADWAHRDDWIGVLL